jgi:hypothetical protein
MDELYIRTEDIRLDDLLKLFVETAEDRKSISILCSQTPVVMIGSRGVGKSFLMRVAQAELNSNFQKSRILPVYVSFISSPLLQSLNDERFTIWMLSKICSAIIRELNKRDIEFSIPKRLSSLLPNGATKLDAAAPLDQINELLENVWRNPEVQIDTSRVPDAQQLKEVIEQICEENQVARVVLFIDEAAHIFLPRQQRLFFSLFRDLRSPYLNCKAAVYPGVTSYGTTFQPTHDARFITVERDVTSTTYVDSMKDIALKQADSTLARQLEMHGENFAVLAYAAYGNPRVLLKSLSKLPKITAREVNLHITEYYRTEVWSEHSLLGNKYGGHQKLIDWARNFIEQTVLPNLTRRNASNVDGKTAYFWIHRDAPAYVHEGMGLLKYTGIVQENLAGTKNGASEIGTKYMVNLGCLLAMEAAPAATAVDFAHKLDSKRFIEFGARHAAFTVDVKEFASLEDDSVGKLVLKEQLARSIDVLDLTQFQKSTLKEVGLVKVVDLLLATDSRIKEARLIGEVRSRRIKNAAYASVFEYLSG